MPTEPILKLHAADEPLAVRYMNIMSTAIVLERRVKTLEDGIHAQIKEHDEMYNAACSTDNKPLAGWHFARSRTLLKLLTGLK